MTVLLKLLLKKGIIDKEKTALLEAEIKDTKRKEEEVILEKGLVDEKFLFKLKSEELKIPLREVLPEDVSFKVLELIPEDSARHYQMIPLARSGDFIEVGMVYPEDIAAQEALKFLARRGNWLNRVFLITPETFQKLLRQYRTLKKEVDKALEELEVGEKEGEKRPFASGFERLAEDAPITKMVNVILRHGVDGRASDIHIEPTRENLRVRYRLDGILHSSIFLPLQYAPAIITRVKILSGMKIDETRIPQDGRFSLEIDAKQIDFRVSAFPTALGEKIAIRVLDATQEMKNFEELGLAGRNLALLKEAIKKPYGLILSTGPTGSGKTTTLYAVLQSLNKEEVNIMTVEEPIEYFINGVNQSQIRPEINYTFASGLRSILRQNPNIIMVGEIRDEETAGLAVQAALTGHLVLSTLHTNNARGVIPRLLDLKVKQFLLPPVLNLVIAQRLLRRLCPECKRKIKPVKEIKDLILREIKNMPEKEQKLKMADDFEIYQAAGCKKCSNGYAGRVGVFEVLSMTSRLGEIILREPTEAKINEEMKIQGVPTMRQDGIIKVLQGMTSIEELLRITEE